MLLKKDVVKSLPITGGKMVGGIDMQGHSITCNGDAQLCNNLPLLNTERRKMNYFTVRERNNKVYI